MPTVYQSAVLVVQGASAAWLDTGLVALPGDTLTLEWTGGTVSVTIPGGEWSPQGFSDPDYLHPYVSTNTNRYGLATAIRTNGDGPPIGIIADGLGYSITPTEHILGTGGRVWLICNDYDYSDNGGSWTLTVSLANDLPPSPPNLTATGLLVNQVPTIRLNIS